MSNLFDVAADMQWTGSTSAFRGAEYNRLSADRLGTANHPDTETRYSIRTLRGRARDLVRNNPYAAGVVEAFADNICGEHGVRLVPRITVPPNDPRGEPLREVGWELERGWKEWGEEYASVDGVDPWRGVERLIVKSWPTDGEVFLRRRKGWDNPYGFAVQLIDPDLLDESYNVPARMRSDPEIVMGIQLDQYGRRQGYWFWDRHPDDTGKKRVWIDASEITHFFVRYRTGQNRGYSLFAPALTTWEMVDGLTEAELVASRYHASKMMLVENNSTEAIQAYATRLAMQNQQGKAPASIRRKITPGGWEELLPGQTAAPWDPTHPNDAFDPFLKTMLRGVARGFAMSYLTFTGDVGEANYSSMRAGLLPERDHWKVLQVVTAAKVHRPVYRDWVGSGLLTGALRLPSPIAADYYSVDWRGRRWQWVDPSNDLEAAEREVRLGINSRQRLAADRGLDYETVIDETADDLAYAEDADVDVAGMGAKAPPAPAPGAAPGAQPVPGPTNGKKPVKNGDGAAQSVHFQVLDSKTGAVIRDEYLPVRSRLALFTPDEPHGD